MRKAKRPCPRCQLVNTESRPFWHPACLEAHKLEHWQGYLAMRAWELKPHVCVRCWLNLDLLKTAWLRFIDEYRDPANPNSRRFRGRRQMARKAADALLIENGFNRGSSFWEANHIVARRDGGAVLGLDNIEILCVPCHKTVTAEQRKRWSKRVAGIGFSIPQSIQKTRPVS